MIAWLAEARRGVLYTCVLRASRVEGGSEGECGRTATMTKEILLNPRRETSSARVRRKRRRSTVKAEVKANGGGWSKNETYEELDWRYVQ